MWLIMVAKDEPHVPIHHNYRYSGFYIMEKTRVAIIVMDYIPGCCEQMNFNSLIFQYFHL